MVRLGIRFNVSDKLEPLFIVSVSLFGTLPLVVLFGEPSPVLPTWVYGYAIAYSVAVASAHKLLCGRGYFGPDHFYAKGGEM